MQQQPVGDAERRVNQNSKSDFPGAAIDESASSDHHHTAAAAIIQHLGTSLESGLPSRSATERQHIFGRNALEQLERKSTGRLLVRQFNDVLIYILLIAAIVSSVVGLWTDAAVILAIVVLNGLLGFFQEWKAERALSELKRMLSPRCLVRRDGREQHIDTADLVPGDVVLLEAGDQIPADVRLAEVSNLKTDESALTGESVSVSKTSEPVAADAELAERRSMAWMGTSAVAGHAVAIVVNTGMRTELGRVAELTRTVHSEKTPLQRRLMRLGKQLGLAAVAIAVAFAGLGWVAGKPAMDVFLTSVSLAVAIVPEGLPAVVTLTMALGVRSMVARRALLRRLKAAETLGSATVICTDKTGTLTENQMTVTHIWLPAGSVDVTGMGYDPAGHFQQDGQRIDFRQRPDLIELLQSAMRCNHAKLDKHDQQWKLIGEPTEGALIVAGYKAWLNRPSPDQTAPAAIGEFSFDSKRKRMTVIQRGETGLVAHAKGAPETILERCTHVMMGNERQPLDEKWRSEIERANANLTGQGLRTLAIARRDLPENVQLRESEVESQLTLLGLVGMIDPPRAGVPEAIQLAHSAGIRVMMITGDAAATALAVARQVGLPAQRAISGQDLANMADDELAQAMRSDVVFARTTPEHKLRIVQLLQVRGDVVGMTGDGVNDAPALKKADIGIAMGVRGTDVAKGASDIVLTDDNFTSIVSAIEEGRRQYENIRKFVRYLLSSNSGEVIAIFLNILVGGPLILLPVQILWINLVTDGLSAVALGLEPAERALMRRPPRDPREMVVDGRGAAIIVACGAYIGLATWLLFQFYLSRDDPMAPAIAGTMAFTGIILIEKANVLNFRSLRSPMSRIGPFSNPWLLVAIAVTIGLQIAVVYVPILQGALHTVPLSASDWLVLIAVSVPMLVVPETVKWLMASRSRIGSSPC